MSEGNQNGQSTAVSELSDEEPPSQQVIQLVGTLSETPIVPSAKTGPEQTIPPLHSVIDPDAIDAFVDSTAESQKTDGRIEFSYYGYTVTICTDRPSPIIRARPQERESTPSVGADD